MVFWATLRHDARMTDPATLTEHLGYVAAFCTTAAFVPQAWLVWRTGRTHDLSLGMFSLFTTGVALWLWYGVRIDSAPITVANVITLALAGYILYMKLTEKSRCANE